MYIHIGSKIINNNANSVHMIMCIHLCVHHADLSLSITLSLSLSVSLSIYIYIYVDMYTEDGIEFASENDNVVAYCL